MRNLLILDKEEYKERNKEFIKLMNSILTGNNDVIYTAYEDKLIRKVRNFKYFGSSLQHILYWIKSFKYAVNALKGKYDNIYCINPIVGIFLGLFNKKAHLVVGGFLFEQKKNKVYYFFRKEFSKLCLKGIDTVLVYGSNEVTYYSKIFQINKFKYIKYGIDFNNQTKYVNESLPEHFIFSGGGSNRDYETLIRAYNNLPLNRLPLVIATQPWRVSEYNCSDILLLNDVVVETFGDVLSRSSALVLSLKDTEISAGHMVMFQAMSLGIPVIVNDIPSIRDYVSEEEVLFYKSKNYKELSKLILNYNYNDNKKVIAAKNCYESELTFTAFLQRVLTF